MEAQKPAEGILLHRDWGSSKMYHVQCECTDDDHAHTVDIEADETGVTVIVYTKETTDFWTETKKPKYDIDNPWLEEFDWFWKGLFNGLLRRLKLTRDIWFKGYVGYQASLIMSEQQALNYSEVLRSAVNDVKVFKDDRQKNKERSEIARLAEQGDCA